MRLIFYVIIGIIPGILLGGQIGILLGIIAGFLLYIIEQVNSLTEKVEELKEVMIRDD